MPLRRVTSTASNKLVSTEKKGIRMKLILDPSLVDLGITDIVVGLAQNVNPQAELTENLKNKQREMEEWALSTSMDEAMEHPITKGYLNMMQSVGRSVKKNPPTVPALIRNIQRRGTMPHVNTIVDIYNVESLRSFLAIGGHDWDKVMEPITFTVSGKEDEFLPILSTKKHVAETDYLYRDANGIMAWMGVRDGENYKFDNDTKNAIFIIVGNAETSIDMRLEALSRIAGDMAECMPGLVFTTEVIHAEA